METNKRLLNFIKLFGTNKGMIASSDMTLTDEKNVTTDEYEISKTFNRHYINNVEKICGNKPNKMGTTLGYLNDCDVIGRIIKSYRNHPSVLKIKNKSFIIEPLTQAINCCLRQGFCPDNAKIVFLVPLDEGKPDKYEVLNYRPLSILTLYLRYRKGNQKPVSVLF